MDARFLCQTRSPVPSLPRQNRACKLKHRSPAVAFQTRTTDNVLIEEKKASLPTDKLAGLAKKTVYNDSWLARLAINYLSQRFQDATENQITKTCAGMRNSKRDYESLTQTARDAWRKFSPTEQHELVKIMLPQCSFTREYFAAFTTLFFVWLVGPCEVRESDFNGRKEKNVVHIKKCRFLEETDCVGMCTNLCKVPSQTFIKHSFGIPVNMVPDFDDMSCEMIYGQEPPKITEDPAFKQPCYKLCNDPTHPHIATCSCMILN
uniref:Beta-carotene isomerase D27-like C-terminal domain-containing protein n=1 Tax=Salix viminalis TaxID=40686 RepID=A0A6N2KM60_SALVM